MYLKVVDVAKHYNVSHDTVLRWIKEKRIAAVNVGRGTKPQYRIHRDAVLQDKAKSFEKPPRIV